MLNKMSLIEQLPTLYGLEKNGKIKIWSASIYSDDSIAWAQIEFGQMDGKKQVTRREYTEGKNIGKKNETTPLTQCINETKRKWIDKNEKEQYSLNIPSSITTHPSSVVEKYFPMLAQTYEPYSSKKKKNTITFPCFLQPKLDGLRCIVSKQNNKILFQSRTGMYFETLEHLVPQLDKVFQKHQVVLDGELYTRDYPFEELSGLIKKKKLTADDREKLKMVSYHIYDVVKEESFTSRLKFIQETIPKLKAKNLFAVETVLSNDTEMFKEMFSKWVGDGYEGIMLRNRDGFYRTNYRSHDLQKYKEFKEDEFEIISFKEGEGRDEGTVLWICKTPEGRTFSVRPRGTIASRKELFLKGNDYIGKKLTVVYQELSEMNVPRFPVGKDIREHY